MSVDLADLPAGELLPLARSNGLTVRFANDAIFGHVVMIRGHWDQRQLIFDLLRRFDDLAQALVDERHPREGVA